MTPSLGSNNLVVWFMELRTPAYFLDLWFITNGVKGNE